MVSPKKKEKNVCIKMPQPHICSTAVAPLRRGHATHAGGAPSHAHGSAGGPQPHPSKPGGRRPAPAACGRRPPPLYRGYGPPTERVRGPRQRDAGPLDPCPPDAPGMARGMAPGETILVGGPRRHPCLSMRQWQLGPSAASLDRGPTGGQPGRGYRGGRPVPCMPPGFQRPATCPAG